MTSEADAKAFKGGRERRGNQLHEASAPTLATGLSKPPAEI